MRTTVILCRGIGETPGRSVLWMLADLLPASEFRVIEHTDWLAQYGPFPRWDGAAYDRALLEGEKSLHALIDAQPGKVIVTGYSGGAALAGNAASRAGHPNLIAAVMLADPLMPEGFVPEGFGISGSRRIHTRAARWLFDVRDPIPVTPKFGWNRRLSDLIGAFSVVDPGGWATNLLGRLRDRRWQQIKTNWWEPLSVLAEYNDARNALKRYGGGDHTSYHTRLVPGTHLTYIAYMAKTIREVNR